MKKIGVIYISMLIFLFPCLSYADNVSLESINVSSKIIENRDEVALFLLIANNGKNDIFVSDIIAYGENIEVLNFDKRVIKANEKLILPVLCRAINESTASIKIELKYMIDNNLFSIFKDTPEIKIQKRSNWYDFFINSLTPILVGVVSSILVNHIIVMNSERKEYSSNVLHIKSYLEYELDIHKTNLDNGSINLEVSNWSKILDSKLYAFALKNFPQQFSIIQDYYLEVISYNSIEDDISGKCDKKESLIELNKKAKIITENLQTTRRVLP